MVDAMTGSRQFDWFLASVLASYVLAVWSPFAVVVIR